MSQFKQFSVIASIIFTLFLTACGGGIGEVENSHPSQAAPQSIPSIAIKTNENNQIEVSWDGQQDAQEYYVYISTTENFIESETTVFKTKEIPYTPETLQAGQKYYVKVRPVWESKPGDESNVESFTAPDIGLPTVAIESSKSVNENSQHVELNVVVVGSGDQDITLIYSTEDDSAVAATDYEAANNKELIIPKDQSSATITINITDDQFFEFSEEFKVTINSASNATIAANQKTAVVTITDDDPETDPELSIADIKVNESVGSALVTVVATNAKSAEFSVDFNTQDDSAVSPDDYTESQGTVTFDVGSTQQTVSIPIIDDTLVENDESFKLKLLNPVGATLGNSQATITITDRELAPPGHSIAAPANPKVIVNSNNFLTEWQPVANAEIYTMYMAKEAGITPENVDSLAGKMRHTPVDSPFGHGIAEGDAFFIVVTAADSNGVESVSSAEMYVKPQKSISGVPDNISVEAGDSQNTLNWNAVEGAESYNVYYSTSPEITPLLAQTVSGGANTKETSVVHENVQNGVMHYYMVTAIVGEVESVPSSIVGATPYGWPQKPSVSSPVEADQQLTLNWDAQSNAEKFIIYTAQDDSISQDSPESLTGYAVHETEENTLLLSGLQNDLTYFFRVVAVDSFGRKSEQSDLVSGTPHGGGGGTNRAPVVANSILDQNATEDSPFILQFAINTFEDPDEDQLTYSASITGETGLPEGMTFNAESRTFNWTPLNEHVGVHSIDVVASDPFDESVTDMFTITVANVNDPPVVQPITAPPVEVGKPFEILLPDNTVSDQDVGDIVTVTVGLTNGSGLPSWLNFNPANLSFSGTPPTVEILDIRVSAEDKAGETDFSDFKLDVKNKLIPPVAGDDKAEIIAKGNSVVIHVLDNDSDADGTLDIASIEVKTLPENKGTTTVNGDGTITYTSSADDAVLGVSPFDSFTYTVKDNTGLESNEATVEISITPWSNQDIGPVGLAGKAVGDSYRMPGAASVSGAGIDIWNEEDSFHYAYKAITGDFDVRVRVADVQNPQRWMKAGLMARESLDPGSKHAFIFVVDNSFVGDDDKGSHLQGRPETGNRSFDYTGRANENDYPKFIRLIRRGNTFNGFESLDGANWRLIGTTNISMSQTLFLGLAVTSNQVTELTTAVFDNYSLLNASVNLPEPFEVSNSPLTNQSVNSFFGNFYKITGLSPDSVYDVEVHAQNGEDLNILLFQDAFNKVSCHSFDQISGFDSCFTKTTTTGELYVWVDGSYTTNGANFSLAFNEWVGEDIGIGQGDTANQGSHEFRIQEFASGGDAIYSKRFDLTGGGSNIGGSSDEFRYVYRHVSGDVVISARVADVQNPNDYSKAGLMIRESNSPGSKFANLFLTYPPNKTATTKTQVHLNIRETDNQNSTNPTMRFNDSSGPPRYVKLKRRGDIFEAYEKGANENWQLISTVEIPMSTDVLVGFAVNSRLSGSLTTANYDNIAIYPRLSSAPDVVTVATSPVQNQNVDINSKYYHITGLTPGSSYGVDVTAANNKDINLAVYSDEFANIECYSFQKDIDHDACLATPNDAGELHVRVDGSYTGNGADFSLRFDEWKGNVVGNASGSHTENPNNSYRIQGSGADIFSTGDNFYFYYQPVQGDVEIIAKVSEQIRTNDWAKSGVMIRESTQPDSKFVDVVKTAFKGVRFQSRNSDGIKVAHNGTRVNNVDVEIGSRWVKLKRRGNMFDAYESSDGKKWLFLGSESVVMSQDVLVGLAVTASTSDGSESAANFENVSVSASSGSSENTETVSINDLPKNYFVDTTDTFIKVTGLSSGAQYQVSISNMTDDADLFVYKDENGELQCPFISDTNFDPAAPPNTCSNMQATSNGELFIRVNGSYTANGTNFDLNVQ